MSTQLHCQLAEAKATEAPKGADFFRPADKATAPRPASAFLIDKFMTLQTRDSELN